MKHRHSTIAGALLSLSLATTAAAQWSGSATTQLAVADGTASQDARAILPAPGGGCYVSWYETMSPIPGGPSTFHVQHLDAGGRQLWPHGGVSIGSGRAVLGVDASGDALVVYGTVVTGVNHFFVTRLDAATGAAVWPPAGVFVGTTTANLAFESVVGLTDGDVAVSWITDDRTQVLVKRFDPSGVSQWTRGIAPTVAGARAIGGTLVAGPGGSVFVGVAYFAGPFVGSPIWLNAQKLDAFGNELWPIAQVAISNSGSASGWDMAHDGVGGLAMSWTTDVEVAVQRVSALGTHSFPLGGIPVSTDASAIRGAQALRFDDVSGEMFVVFREQSFSGFDVRVQRIDATGTRLESATGRSLLPGPFALPIDTVHAVDVGGGVLVAWNRSSASGDAIEGIVTDSTGTASGGTFAIASSASNKSDAVATTSEFGFAMFAFTDDGTGDEDVLVQNVLPDGSLGGVATATVRNGGGVNPTAFTSVTPPAIGTSWTTEIAHAPSDVATAMILHARPDVGTIVLGFGEVLVDLTGPSLIGQATFAAPSPDPYSVAIPPNLGLVGLAFSAQGLIASPGAFQLTNAIDIVIGL
ncbi:MAG: hypothetical protein KDB80_01690 [Planctomycetes bacterium]|nr:hypothetical protein [Planctomycetota bacterium]